MSSAGEGTCKIPQREQDVFVELQCVPLAQLEQQSKKGHGWELRPRQIMAGSGSHAEGLGLDYGACGRLKAGERVSQI